MGEVMQVKEVAMDKPVPEMIDPALRDTNAA